jgi:hypothetical protein
VTAVDGASRALFQGCNCNDVDAYSRPHIKLYGNATTGDGVGQASAAFIGGSAFIDLGGSRESRISAQHGVWPITWPLTSGDGGTKTVHLDNSRLTGWTNYNSGVTVLEGLSHTVNGIISATAWTCNAAQVAFGAGNNFASSVTLNAAVNAMPVGAFKGGYTLGSGFRGTVDGRVITGSGGEKVSAPIVMADDTVCTAIKVIGAKTAILAITMTNAAGATVPLGLVFVRVDATPSSATIAVNSGASFAHSTGVPTGTTGSDGAFTIYPQNNGTVIFENRLGGSRTIVVEQLAATGT